MQGGQNCTLCFLHNAVFIGLYWVEISVMSLFVITVKVALNMTPITKLKFLGKII